MGKAKTDKKGYDDHYKGLESALLICESPSVYINLFRQGLLPFYKGGNTKGYVRGLAVQELLRAVKNSNKTNQQVKILDAGSGQGELSVYLACLGFNVIGIDISEEARVVSIKLAEKVGVTNNCMFLAESLESIPLNDNSIDYVIGHASLHHFIKYENIPDELDRVLKLEGEMFFADSFGENKIYHLFHDNEQMYSLGDVILTKELIDNYFINWNVSLVPTDWFVMFDKLFLKLLPKKFVQKSSFLWWHLDRLIPRSRLSLFLSGAIMTHVKKYRCILP